MRGLEDGQDSMGAGTSARRAAQLAPPQNSYASETPVTDGERVYFYFGNLGLFCFDLNGKALWKKQWEMVPTRYGWGTAASPVVYKDRLYVVNDNDEKSFMVALDKKTGEQIWRVEREVGTNWATPYIWENKLRTEIITPGTKKVHSYDLNGKALWEFSGMSSISIPTPFSKFDLLYITSGYVGDNVRPAYAIKPGASGDISLKEGEQSNQFIAWYQPQAGPYNPSPLVYGNYYYTLLDVASSPATMPRPARRCMASSVSKPRPARSLLRPGLTTARFFA